MESNNYLSQRLAAIGVGGSNELEALKAENLQLRQQLEQLPQVNLKSEAQRAFEQSAEFEHIFNVFYMRFIRSKFADEFRNSQHLQDFQSVANQAFEQFEANYKKEAPKDAAQNSSSKKNSRNGNANSGVSAGEDDAGK